MWAPIPYLAIALEVLRLRGFRYVSHYAWGKDRIGTGYWSRNKHELLLIGTRGKVPCPAPGTQWESLIEAPVTEHSHKPECFLEMIDKYFPNVPKIELNRRGPPRPGWDAWGNEALSPDAALARALPKSDDDCAATPVGAPLDPAEKEATLSGYGPAQPEYGDNAWDSTETARRQAREADKVADEKLAGCFVDEEPCGRLEEKAA